MNIHPPTAGERFWRGVGYCFVSLVGIANVITPTSFVLERQLGTAAIIWALFLASSFPAAVATWYGRYRIEYALLPLFTAALVVAVLSTWFRAFGDGVDPTLVPRAASASALICLCIARWLTLHRLIKVLQWTQSQPN